MIGQNSDESAQVAGLVSGLADRRRDRRRGAGEAGVDERESVGVVPQVGVPDREADLVQPRGELDEFHPSTVTGRRPGRPGHLPSAD